MTRSEVLRKRREAREAERQKKMLEVADIVMLYLLAHTLIFLAASFC